MAEITHKPAQIYLEDVEKIDDGKNEDIDRSPTQLLESKFSHLTRKQVFRVYWRSIAWGLAFAMGVLCDGYAIVREWLSGVRSKCADRAGSLVDIQYPDQSSRIPDSLTNSVLSPMQLERRSSIPVSSEPGVGSKVDLKFSSSGPLHLSVTDSDEKLYSIVSSFCYVVRPHSRLSPRTGKNTWVLECSLGWP